jgi:hypothetical protein
MELSRSPSIPRFRPNLQKIGVKHIALQFDIRRRRIALTYFIWFRPSNVMEHTPPLNSAVVPLPVVGLDQTRRAKLDPQYRWRDRQQRKFVSICISDPAARARPDEEAQVHIAE